MIIKANTLFEGLKFLKRQPKCSFGCRPPWNILFFGADEFSLFSLKALVNEYRNGQIIGNLEVCTTLRNSRNVVHSYAEKENLKLRGWPVDIGANEYHTGLVVSFGHLIPGRIIDKFPLGMINVHASLLPRWRGAAPIIYSLANGDTETGVSLMKIKPKQFDTGEIISQKAFKIPKEMNMHELHDELGYIGATELIECLKDLPNKLRGARLQPEENITYAPKINNTFARIDWKNMTSNQIYNLERAVKGLMPLTSTWNGETIKLFNIKKLEKCRNEFSEGFISYDEVMNLLKIVCLDKTYISVEKIQVFHKKVMTAKDFNNGYLKKTPIERRYFI